MLSVKLIVYGRTLENTAMDIRVRYYGVRHAWKESQEVLGDGAIPDPIYQIEVIIYTSLKTRARIPTHSI